MAKLTKDQIITAVYQQIEDSEGYDTDELNGLRKDALDYYYNRPNAAPSAPGRSSLQSSDVADMIEAVTAQVMPAFEMDNLVEFEPTGEDDMDQARLETEAVNWVVMQQNMGYYEIQQAIRDALLLRNGVMKVYLDEKEQIDTQRYGMLTELELGDLKLNAVQDLRSVENGYTVEILSEEDTFYNVKVVTKSTERKVCTRAVDPSMFSWERDYDSIYLQDCRFVSERSLPTRSELIQKGYKKSLVNSLNAGGNDTQIDSLARNQHSQRRNWKGATKADDIIEFHECYYRLDADGDGVSELLKICVADKKILEIQEMQYIPYASGTPFLQPHRFNGLGMFDKLRYVQDQKTFGIRQWADNTNNANNARMGVVDGAANIDDVVNSRPGGVIRMRSPDAIVPIVAPDIGASAEAFLNYADKMRSERGGASLDLQAAELQVAGDTAHGVERQMSAKEQLAALITRTIAETLIRSTYLLVHKALRLYVPDALQFRVSGQFKSANPAEWPERKTMSVQAGLSLAERMHKKAALETIVLRQDALQQQGKYVSPADVYNAQLDWMRVQGIDDPERYFTDPASEEAQQWQQQQAMQAQAQQEYQQMLLDMQKEVEDRAADNADAKVMEDARQFDEELRFKYWEAGEKRQLEEDKASAQVAMQLVTNERQESTSRADSNQQPAD